MIEVTTGVMRFIPLQIGHSLMLVPYFQRKVYDKLCQNQNKIDLNQKLVMSTFLFWGIHKRITDFWAGG